MISILGLITGLAGPLAQLGSRLADLATARQQAKTNVEIKQIDQEIEEIHDRRAVLVAEAGSRLNSIVRFCFAIGPLAFVTKVTLWDKVLGSFAGCRNSLAEMCRSFTTDPLDPNMWAVVMACIGFYFLYDVASKVIKR